MGNDCDPWPFRNFDYASNVGTPPLAKQSTNSMVYPSYADPCGFFHLNSALMPPSNGQKRFMVFDKSGDQTNMIYSSFGSQFPYPFPTSNETKVSNETNASNGNVGNVNEEMHEDTEEIDALLYSDSENDYVEEEASTGHSPVGTTENIDDDDEDDDEGEEEEEVASSAVSEPPHPLAKRRRVESELDPSLADTASSTHCRGPDNEERKKAKREKIQEAVRVLRQIIPCDKGKDTAAVLDEAIKYLKSLRLKAKGLGVPNTLN